MAKTQNGKPTKAAQDARLRIEEHGLGAMKAMIDRKAQEWGGGEMAKFLRPKTLLAKSNCEDYIGQLDTPTPPPPAAPRRPAGPEPTGAAYEIFRGFGR